MHYIFFEKYVNFWVFLSVPHLVDNYAKNMDDRGGTLFAIAHYAASWFRIIFKITFCTTYQTYIHKKESAFLIA